MERRVLDTAHIHPAVQERVLKNHRDTVEQVIRAVERDEVVVVGMAQNPHCKRARKALEKAGVPFTDLEFGSYLKGWRLRTAIKMWSGWPTFPMVFVRGTLIGGADETEQRLADGSLREMLQSRGESVAD